MSTRVTTAVAVVLLAPALLLGSGVAAAARGVDSTDNGVTNPQPPQWPSTDDQSGSSQTSLTNPQPPTWPTTAS